MWIDEKKNSTYITALIVTKEFFDLFFTFTFTLNTKKVWFNSIIGNISIIYEK